jgi:outer membrane receptor protein involved in Fe transport
VNPAAGVTVDVGYGFNVYGSYAESSRVPTPVELTCADPEDPCRLPNAFVSDPPLDQIVGRTWETGVRRSAGRLDWSLAAFATTAADDIIFVSSGTLRGEGHFENVPKTHRRGVEAIADLSIGRVSAFATYTLQRATFGDALRIASHHHPEAVASEIVVEPGDWLPGVPAHSGKAGVEAPLTGRVTIAATVRAQSTQYFRGDEANLLRRLPGFAIAEARVAYRITSRITAVGNIQNIFDARYSTFGVLGDASLLGNDVDDPRFSSPGAPRSAWVGVDLRF